MNDDIVRPMQADDWIPASIPAGSYSNLQPLTGFRRRDGDATPVAQGNALHPIHVALKVGGDADVEAALAQTHAALRAETPGLFVRRYTARMPYWTGHTLPTEDDYTFVNAPQPLTTTSITVLLVPQARIRDASLGFYFERDHLPSLRQRLLGRPFQGVVGNVGYYMTAALIGNDPSIAKAWAHSKRYPDYPLPTLLSYIGFALYPDPETGAPSCTFHGAHPGTVGVRRADAPGGAGVEILPRLEIDGYRVTMNGQTFTVTGPAVDGHDDPDATRTEVALWTPALQTPEIQTSIAEANASAGAAQDWQRCAPMVPLSDRVHVFVANEGDGQQPVSVVAAVWDGAAPVPSFGGVLSFTRAFFQRLYGSIETFRQDALGSPVRIAPLGKTSFERYVQMLGGLVPAVVDGEHVLCARSAQGVMAALSRYGNATSPLAQCGRETLNFDLVIREPAGMLVQTADEAGGQIGWVLFDGRHEASIGASVVDMALLLHKMQHEGLLPPIRQAVFLDGGSGMKAYRVRSDGASVQLDLLNRVAAGSRNPPGIDPDGLNLYTLLALAL